MQGPRLGGSVVAEVLLAKDCKSRKMRTSAATNKATAEMRMKTAKSDHDTCQRRNKLKVKHEGSVCALCQALLGRSKTSRHVYGDDRSACKRSLVSLMFVVYNERVLWRYALFSKEKNGKCENVIRITCMGGA
jgi:hypothetical protein